MVRLSVDDLVADAVDAFKNNECIEEPPEEPVIQVKHVFLFYRTSCARTSNQPTNQPTNHQKQSHVSPAITWLENANKLTHNNNNSIYDYNHTKLLGD